MSYTRDKDAYCSQCRSKVRFSKCARCDGKGGGMTTQCSSCGSTGYACPKSHKP